MTTEQTIQEARSELAAGHDKQAARLLTEAIYQTHDGEAAEEIHAIATEGRSKAGRFGKARWDEILRLADVRASNGHANGNGATNGAS